jgi:CheY-like chemotaxis protein
MGGDIEAESEPGRGSCLRFSVDFGVQPGADAAPADSEAALPDAGLVALGGDSMEGPRSSAREGVLEADQAALAGAHVLLVEDNAVNQEVAREVLRRAGIRVTVVEDGQQAIDILARERFDGVLMDCQMPVMDGYTATRVLRAQERLRCLPIIAMTADTMAGDRERALAAGMNDHIVKPLKMAQLFATMARWIRPGGSSAEAVAAPAAPHAKHGQEIALSCPWLTRPAVRLAR